MKSIFTLGVGLALAAVVGCGARNTEDSDSMAASANNAVDVSRFPGEYELVADKSGNCKKLDCSKIRISHPEVVTGINYDDPTAPPTLGLEKDSLEVVRLQESKELAFALGHKVCLQLFGWDLSHQMTLKGDILTVSRPHPSSEYNFECSYKKVQKAK